MRLLPQRRAYVLSFIAHAVLWMLLLRYETRVSLARVRHEGAMAAARHAPTFQRNQAQVDADRLRRIREVADRLGSGGEATKAAANGRAGEPTDPKVPPAKPRTADLNDPHGAPPKPQSLDDIYNQGRRDYEAARQKFIDAEAKRLAKITGESYDSARQSVEAAQPRRGNGTGQAAGDAGAGSGSGKAGKGGNGAAVAADLEWMQADAQRLLARAVNQQQQDGSGATVSGDAQRQAYEILNQSQQFAADAQKFAPAVDWTALMGHPLTATSLYGTPDGAGGAVTFHDLRKVEPEAERTLRGRFRQQTRPVLFTRHIGRHGSIAADWIAPDSWYVIGPFENSRREAIDRSFPPEIEIDRDATYTGKDGRPITWEYVRVHGVGVVPPHPEEYAIYYAYTEVRAEQPMDCWLALGSDDHSKLWVNGLMIWSDTRNEKEWTPTEGFRRVHLEPGVNRFLLRLENGWRGTMFSVALLLP